MSTTKRLAAVVGAGALVFAMFGTALAGAVEYATVTGHQASTSDNNSADWWETEDLTNCTKVGAGEGDIPGGAHSYVLTSDYELVVVKTGSSNGSDPNSLTLFANATAGQTVWADSNGNSVFDALANPDDQGISHIIFCDGSESTPTPTFSLDTGGETDTPTGPATDSLGSSTTSSPADGAWLLVVALGVLLASVVVLTPARAKSRR